MGLNGGAVLTPSWKVFRNAVGGVLLWLLSLIGLLAANTVNAKGLLHYEFTFVPEQQAVDVHIKVPSQVWLIHATFNLSRYDISRIEYNGELRSDQNQMKWSPPAKNAFLKYRVKINGERGSSGAIDAYVGPDWAILRGEELIPPVRIRKKAGVEVRATMEFVLPASWPTVHTGWQRLEDNRFAIVNPLFSFPRPAGWIVAGDLGSRHEQFAQTQVRVSSPQGNNFRQMEKLSFITLIWPHLARAIDIDTPYILITGAGDPFWRGGLSGPNSLYIHSERPLISENGTSTLLHELFHVTSNISSNWASEWIVEGLAEYYSVEILYRAGGLTQSRREQVFAGLRDWSKKVKTLKSKRSSGVITARATVLFDELNSEILAETDNAYCLDHLVRRIQQHKKLTDRELAAEYKALVGKESTVLQSSLLRKPNKTRQE